MNQYSTNPKTCAPIPAGWSVFMGKKPFNPGRNLYELYRKQPPARRGAAHAIAYWQGYDGVPSRHVVGSSAAWAWKAGRDNRSAESSAMSDNKHYPLDAPRVDPTTDIMTMMPVGQPTDASCSESRTAFRGKKSGTYPVGPFPVLHILNGDLSPAGMLDPVLQRVWERLSASEQGEADVSFVDDLRIAKLCILEIDKGNPDPWRSAFWQYMGIVPEKWLGILAEREAYKKTLGPTLAEQLQDPAFLASLEPLVRASLFASEPQMRIPFQPESASPEKRRIA